MKDPITGRDLFVIATLCTGFGVLLSWGLFYRWGSLPPSKPIDWPAWVQAVGSVAAILAAIGIAAHERHVAKTEAAHRSLLERQSRHTRANSAMERFQKVIADQLDFARTQQIGTVETEFRPLPLPEEMKEVERDCYLMEDAGGDILTVTNYFLEAQSLAKGQRIPMSNVGLFIEHLEHAEAMSASALKKIRAPLWRS